MRAMVKGLCWFKRSELDPVKEYLFKNKLTIIPRNTSSFSDPDPIRLYVLNEEWIGVPRSFLLKHGQEICPEYKLEDCLPQTYPKMSITDSDFKLRPHQEKAYSDILSAMREQVAQHGFFGGLLEAWTAFGKSLTSTAICREIGLRTIVFVHRMALADQWKDSIKQFFPGLTVGIVGGGKRDWKDKDIVIAVMQTLYSASAKLEPEFYKNFGIVVVDEVHVTGAPTFASVIPNFHARYVLGVSGTMRRADGCEDVFRFLIGDVVHSSDNTARVNPKIWVRDTHFSPEYPLDHLEKPQLLNVLADNKERTARIAYDLFRAYQKKRKPLVLSERLKILNNLPILVDWYCEKEGVIKPTHGFYIGGKKKNELLEAGACDIVYATYQLAKEGIDLPERDYLALSSPVSDPEQSIGRVCRSHPGKPQPVVADYVDFNLQRPRAQFYKRKRLYKSLGWEIIE